MDKDFDKGLMDLIKERSVRTCNDLCLGCGTCVSVCPQGAVKMIETPAGLLVAQVDDSKCNDCGLCLKCCPGIHLKQDLIFSEVDPFKGKVVATYLGQAVDQKILSEGQSGGVVTALLCYLLDSGRITGAIVTQMPEDGSLRPKSIVARDKSTICRAQGSKYCPVAVNSVIPKEKEEVDDGEKLAVVGLPCHIHGIRNVQSRLGRWQGLFTIGLVCERILAFGAIDHLIDKAHLSRSDVTYFRFKSKLLGGWPGDVYIRTQDGVVHRLANIQRLLIKDIYTPSRCRLCFDRLNVLSELVVGDPWGIRKDKEGYSIIIARTERAKDALLSAESAGWLKLESVRPELVFKGQSVEQKRWEWAAFTEAWRQMGGTLPEFCIDKSWITGCREIQLKPYRRKLEWAQRLSSTRRASDVLRAAKREFVFNKFRRILAPKRWARFLGRHFVRLMERSLGIRRDKSVFHLGQSVIEKKVLMRTNIALTGIRLHSNLGGPSILVAIKTALNDVFPDAEYTLFVPYSYYESDVPWAPKYGVKIAPLPNAKWLFLSALLKQYTRLSIGPAHVKNSIRLLRKADLIIDIRGIIFADKLGGNSFRGRMSEGSIFVIGRVLGKSVIKYTSSFGAFDYRWNHIFAKIYLGHFTKLILARDETSRKHLEELNIKTPILTVPDTAFLLPSSESEASKHYATIRDTNPLIGLSVSFQAKKRSPASTDYLIIMANFVRYLIDKYAIHIVLIPNEQSKGLNNDHQIAEEISREVRDVRCDVLDTDNLLAQEIKGVIQQCELIVAARYHTIVASLSLGIPTLAIGWHHKYAGVLGLFGQQHRICNIEELNLEDLVKKFNDLWQNREEVGQTIAAFIPDVKEQIIAGARAVREVVSVKAK